MIKLVFYIALLVSYNFVFEKEDLSLKKIKPDHNTFKLSFGRVGFGINMYNRQPIFNVDGTKFIFTSEDVWEWPGRTPAKDTLLTGDFRISSIDSITNLITCIKDSVIKRSDNHWIGGSATWLDISTEKKNYCLIYTTAPIQQQIKL